MQQPLDVVVQGRFGNISSFLGDLRTLVSVRGKRLDARGRLYSVSSVSITAPDSPDKFPIVKAAVKLNAYAFSAPVPATPTPDPSTSTDTSSEWDGRGRSDPLMAKRSHKTSPPPRRRSRRSS